MGVVRLPRACNARLPVQRGLYEGDIPKWRQGAVAGGGRQVREECASGGRLVDRNSEMPSSCADLGVDLGSPQLSGFMLATPLSLWPLLGGDAGWSGRPESSSASFSWSPLGSAHSRTLVPPKWVLYFAPTSLPCTVPPFTSPCG